MIDSGDTAWVLACTALVLFMTPGLAFFYAGMVRVRNVLSMMMVNFVPLGIVTVLWLLLGYSIAFGNDAGGGLFGDFSLFGMQNLDSAPAPALHVISPGVAIPLLAFVAYQMMFAVITPALVTGATADRLRIGGWAVFVGIWSLIVYAPIAHWVFSPQGWLAGGGTQDWAGGLVVHASAGAAAIAVLLVVGRRKDWPNAANRPNSVPLVLIGAGILWFGWFGFNAGDGLAADGIAAQALLNTASAAAAGMLAWLLVERYTEGRPTVLGAVTGAVAGLATITPCAGYVGVMIATAIGFVAGIVCHFALKAKFVFRYDDALDVIAVHFVGGVLGTFLLGFVGQKSVNPIGRDGLFFGGGLRLLGWQLLGIAAVVAFSFVLSWLIAVAVDRTIGLRTRPEDEDNLDAVQESSAAYALDVVASGQKRGSLNGATPAPALPAAADGRLSLVTALVEAPDPVELRRALTGAGALSIVLSQASLYTGEVRTEVVRGHHIEVDFHDRLRVEVTAAAADVPRVAAALDTFADGAGAARVVTLATVPQA
jgi:ammonium transporter